MVLSQGDKSYVRVTSTFYTKITLFFVHVAPAPKQATVLSIWVHIHPHATIAKREERAAAAPQSSRQERVSKHCRQADYMQTFIVIFQGYAVCRVK